MTIMFRHVPPTTGTIPRNATVTDIGDDEATFPFFGFDNGFTGGWNGKTASDRCRVVSHPHYTGESALRFETRDSDSRERCEIHSAIPADDARGADGDVEYYFFEWIIGDLAGCFGPSSGCAITQNHGNNPAGYTDEPWLIFMGSDGRLRLHSLDGSSPSYATIYDFTSVPSDQVIQLRGQVTYDHNGSSGGHANMQYRTFAVSPGSSRGSEGSWNNISDTEPLGTNVGPLGGDDNQYQKHGMYPFGGVSSTAYTYSGPMIIATTEAERDDFITALESGSETGDGGAGGGGGTGGGGGGDPVGSSSISLDSEDYQENLSSFEDLYTATVTPANSDRFTVALFAQRAGVGDGTDFENSTPSYAASTSGVTKSVSAQRGSVAHTYIYTKDDPAAAENDWSFDLDTNRYAALAAFAFSGVDSVQTTASDTGFGLSASVSVDTQIGDVVLAVSCWKGAITLTDGSSVATDTEYGGTAGTDMGYLVTRAVATGDSVTVTHDADTTADYSMSVLTLRPVTTPSPLFVAAMSNTTSSGSVAVTKDAAVADDDLLIMAVQVSAGSGDTHTIPAGWTELTGSPVDSGGDDELVIAAKIAASEGSSWSFSSTAGGEKVAVVRAYRPRSGTWADLDDALDAYTISSDANGDDDSTFTTSGVTPTDTDRLAVMIAGSDVKNATGSSDFQFSGYSNVVSYEETSSYMTVGWGELDQTTSVAAETVDVTMDTGAAASGAIGWGLFMLKPPSAAAPTTPDPVTNLSATTTETSVTLTWTPPADVDSYIVRYSSSAYPATSSDGTGATPDGASATVTGLTAGTVYYFSIWAVLDSVESTPAYTSVTTATPPDPVTVDPVLGTFVSNVTDTTATLQWTAPANYDGFEVRYDASAYPTTPGDDGDGTVWPAGGSATGVTITGLTAETTYYVTVWASLQGDYSSAANATFTTEATETSGGSETPGSLIAELTTVVTEKEATMATARTSGTRDDIDDASDQLRIARQALREAIRAKEYYDRYAAL